MVNVMETLPALLAICDGNIGAAFPSQKVSNAAFGVCFFMLA